MSPIARPGRRYRLASGVAVVALGTFGTGLAGRQAQAQVGTPDRVGQWTVPFAEPGVEGPPVAEAMAVLPDGRVLYLDGGDDPSPADGPDRGAGVLDLRGGAPVFERPADEPSGAPRSSADLVLLSDGRLLIGTGGSGAGQAPGATTLFDPRPSRFHPAGSMAHAHRRASLVTLSDGQVLVAGGSGESMAPTPFFRPLPAETFDPRRGSWGHNPGAAATLPLEPRLHLMPNGEVFYAGVGRDAPELGSVSEELLARERFFDPVTSTWRMAGLAPYGPRDGSLSVLLPIDPPFDQSTLLTAGGSLGRTGAGSPAVALATLTTVDRGGNIAHSRTGDLRDPRWLSSAVALPDGSILALGGSSGGPGTAVDGFAVPSAELYDPAAAGWRG